VITTCCNPDCRAPFNFQEGRLVRFCKALPNDDFPESEHPVEHFWLCGDCSKRYEFEFESKLNLKLKSSSKESPPATIPELVVAA